MMHQRNFYDFFYSIFYSAHFTRRYYYNSVVAIINERESIFRKQIDNISSSNNDCGGFYHTVQCDKESCSCFFVESAIPSDVERTYSDFANLPVDIIVALELEKAFQRKIKYELSGMRDDCENLFLLMFSIRMFGPCVSEITFRISRPAEIKIYIIRATEYA